MPANTQKPKHSTRQSNARTPRAKVKTTVATKSKSKPRTARVEVKLSPETKRLGERAALVSELTLTDYLAKLIKEDAPKTIKAHTEIQLTNQRFDDFMALCDRTREPSNEIIEAAKLLDKDGF